MPSFLEIWKRAGVELVPLAGDPRTIGKSEDADVCIGDDRSVSRMHAVVEPVGAGWCVRDLGSRNGTFVNGERIWSQKALHAGDELKLGTTRLVFRAERPSGDQTVMIDDRAPTLTNRERDVLVALCRPLLSGGGAFTQPASIRRIADELVVSLAAVKQHLAHLYDKFAIYDEPDAAGAESRRVRLANEALGRGVVSIADLRDQPR